MRGGGWIGVIAVGVRLLWPTASQAVSLPPVFFRELMWAGTDRSTADEWLVLGNSTNAVINLDGWRLTTMSGVTENLVTALDGQQIAAHGSLLIASHDQHHQFTNGESVLAIDPDLVVSSLTLSNSALQLKLYQPGSLSPVDVAGSGKAPLAGTTKPPTAMERLPTLADGTLKASWSAVTSSRHLDAGSTSLALPDHAGRPSITTGELAPLPATISSSVSIAVVDPEGEDDIGSVTLSCPEGLISLVDTGLAGDSLAGDRRYSGRIIPATSGSASCLATVTDRSGLSRTKPISRSAYIRTAHVELSELLPAPLSGSEEFIELHNLESAPIDLTSWQLDDRMDGGSAPYSLTQTIPANGYLVLPASQTKLALNNDGDEANLISPEGTVIDTAGYESAMSGQSWARFGSSWQWASQLTPGSANQADPAPAAASPAAIATPTVAVFAGYQSQTAASLTGQVVALPGTLSTHSWLLDDGTGVAEIYLNSGSFGPLRLGDWVSVTGRRSSVRLPRLLLDTGSIDPPIAPAQTIRPRSLADQLALASAAPAMVAGQLTITKVNTKSLVATIADRSVKLVWSELMPNQVFPQTLVAGQTITVTAILTNGDDETPELILRAADDLVIGSPPAVATTVTPASTSTTAVSGAVVTRSAAGFIQSVRPAAAKAAAVVRNQLHAARLRAAERWLVLATEATMINQQLASLIARRSISRTNWWQQFDRSVMVGLLTVLGALQLTYGWRRFATASDPPFDWSGG